MGVRRGIDREKVGCRSLIDANLEGQVGVNKFELYKNISTLLDWCCSTCVWLDSRFHIVKASFTLSRCTLRCVLAVCSRRAGVNRDESWSNSSAFIHSRQCYGSAPVWGKRLTRSFPVMLRFVTVHPCCSPGGATVCPDTPRLCPGHRRQSSGVTKASHGSKKAKPRCYMVAYEYQWNSRETYNRYVFAKYRIQVTYQGKNEQQ